MEAKKKKTLLIIFGLILYVVIGIIIYFIIKEFYRPEEYDENSANIYNAIDINDETNLNHALNTGGTYALIYGEFKADDLINDIFLGNNYSYIREVKVDSTDGIVSTNDTSIKISKEYSIYDVKIPGLNFDLIHDEKTRTINDIRHKNITYEYYTKRPSYVGTMLCYIENRDVNCISFYKNMTITELREKNLKNVNYTENSFIVIWALMLFLFLIGIDNFDENDFTLNVRE